MTNTDTPDERNAYQVGDEVEHNLMPGFVMTVQDVATCQPGEAHRALLITDPEGAQDWLCSRDVRLVARGNDDDD